MKKTISVLLMVVMVISLCACGKEKIEYYEINSILPIPSGLEQCGMEENDTLVAYFYYMDAKTNEEAEGIMQEYYSVLEGEGIRIVHNADVGFELKYNDELIGTTMWYSIDDEYRLMVTVVKPAN